MTKDNKVLALLQAIAETLEISPQGQPVRIDPEELEKSMSKVEIQQIFQKMADDFGVIELLGTPYSLEPISSIEDRDVYKFTVPDADKFKKLLDAYEAKSIDNNENKKSPRFHFDQGVLFRDFCDTVLKIGGENTLEYRLVQTALKTPVGEKIDTLTDELEMEWRQLYDATKRLNDKIKTAFKVDEFLQIDYQNKNVRKTIE